MSLFKLGLMRTRFYWSLLLITCWPWSIDLLGGMYFRIWFSSLFRTLREACDALCGGNALHGFSVLLNGSELEESSSKTQSFSSGALCYWWMLTSRFIKCTAFFLLLLSKGFQSSKANIIDGFFDLEPCQTRTRDLAWSNQHHKTSCFGKKYSKLKADINWPHRFPFETQPKDTGEGHPKLKFKRSRKIWIWTLG